MQATQSLRFSRKDPKQFFKTLNQRVNKYFKEKKVHKTGNWKLYFKTVVMFSLFITPYVLIIVLNISLWYKLLLAIVMGVGMAGIGMNVMHDGNHGSFSRYPFINKIMGSSIYFLAGNVFNWKIQHNLLHHTYTNILGHDEDLEAGRVLRFSKNAEWMPHHRFQHLYFFFLYGLLTINWAIFTDLQQMKRYLKKKLSYANSKRPSLQWIGLFITKVMYWSIWIIIPMILINAPWWSVIVGFIVMHYTAGLILSLVFQLAHIMEDAEMPMPEASGTMKNTWAIHQLLTTVNFSTKNRFVNWFTGGLNHQIEHHIFPHISHVHYTKISEIVKKTAREFNLPYNEYKTTRSAILSHFRFLKQMGVQPI
ncbi:MAG: acyl-CoA desaturase [Flavobacteriaceae bacterium]|jgi:linoleoyl-CoA desaturase|nr:acyl-CoA desaturase [Flavobacteriaceae bacterium]MDA9630337.1 acyl-CoA desaturase [Flavobacteriaceae bacterium]MDA9668794.1 acyl-CoA desaturase [Flavobacteriaceae bacterium]